MSTDRPRTGRHADRDVLISILNNPPRGIDLAVYVAGAANALIMSRGSVQARTDRQVDDRPAGWVSSPAFTRLDRS